MLKVLFFVALASAVQCLETKGKLKQDPVQANPQLLAQQGQRVHGFRPRSDWSRYYPSWSMPSIPSMSNFFKDDDDSVDSAEILERLSAVEQMANRLASLELMVKELNERLKKESTGITKPEGNKVEALPCKESLPKETMDKEPQKGIEQPQESNVANKPVAMEPVKLAETSETVEKNAEIAEDVVSPEELVKTTDTMTKAKEVSLPAAIDPSGNEPVSID